MVLKAIAKVTFIESLRNKTLYIILLFAFVFAALAKTLGFVSATTDPEKMIIIAGLTGITFFGFIIALFSGMSLMHKELSARTIYTILSKPVDRYQFIVGKYLGLMVLYTLIVGLMGVIFLIFHFIHGGEFVIEFVYYAVLLIIELSVVTSIAIFFSLISSPIFSAIATFCLFVAGNAMNTIFDRILYLDKENWLGRYIIIGMHMILPNFYNFNITQEIVSHYSVPFIRVVLASGYGLIFTAFFLYISILIFSRKRLQ
jgi:ABC-type transport system involved in multi-copper enzyme maturation permease subunit